MVNGLVGAGSTAWRSRLAAAASRALDLVLPPRCLGCGGPVRVQGELCPACWGGIRFLSEPLCSGCGAPLAHALPGGRCAACFAEPLALDRARAAIAYDAGSRPLILAFKHGARTEGVGLFGRWMARAGAGLLEDADLVVPVPLHRWRLLRRGFNQSALLGRETARHAGRPFVPDLLLRRRHTGSQQGLGAAARRRNVTGAAFAVGPRHLERVRAARVVLVDDVLTTGATLGACAEVLRRAGAARVDAVTLARVVNAGDHLI